MSRIRMVACGVFRPAVEWLELSETYPQLEIEYLESKLHLEPLRLREELMRRLKGEPGEELICLYGCCAPDIDELCRSCRASRPAGELCYEMLLGRERYLDLLQETAGTYFIEQELIRKFETYCVEPLELDDPELREMYFQHYQRLVYVRQPGDPNLERELRSITELIELPVEIHDADYTELEAHLRELLEGDRPSVPPRRDTPRR